MKITPTLRDAMIGAAVVLFGTVCSAQPELAGADWELHALGINTPERLGALQDAAGGRVVTIAIVGQGGVSRSLLEPVLVEGNTLEYRQWPEGQEPDPGSNTHDTQAARVILDLTLKLKLSIRLLVYHVGEPNESVAQGFADAGKEADLVALYQSFWGNIAPMPQSILQAEKALFISPYVEVGDRPTNTCLQGHAAKPWGEGIAHFVTTIPLAKRAPDSLLTPRSHPEQDSEIINFVAPSYYASGAGGTCPSAEVTAAVAAYTVAASPEKPSPVDIVSLLRKTSTVDRAALGTLPEFTEAAIASVEAHIAALAHPAEGKPRKLDAEGVLNLWAIHEALSASR